MDNNENDKEQRLQLLLDSKLSYVQELESQVDPNKIDNKAEDEIQTKLLEISSLYKEIAKLQEGILLTQDYSSEILADAWLDVAIACKLAGQTKDCVQAHLRRMEISPRFKSTDAIRLLGLGEDDDLNTVQELSINGIFEVEEHTSSKGSFRPSKQAIDIGRKVKEIFYSRQYTLFKCQSYLLPHIDSVVTNTTTNKNRIFSANSFFNHRHDVYEATRSRDPARPLEELEILVWLFLFGLALDCNEVIKVLGSEDVRVLKEARLLRYSPADKTMFVAEVQIYPLDGEVFGNDHPIDSVYCLFITDFPMESLRLNRNAIMPVGYDTLELLSLTAGKALLQQDTTTSVKSQQHRILDLCCGCGIQGIFAWKCYEATAEESSSRCNLVSIDLNDRAINFVTANLALNEVGSFMDSEEIDSGASAMLGDLYEPLLNLSHETKFDWVVCNPPFVAVPLPATAPSRMSPALYAVGGGIDGMDCLRRILQGLFVFLSDDPNSIVLMVTEVPNVEESCIMLQSYLPDTFRSTACIRVAYVEEDVETVEQYSREREIEATGETASSETKDWSLPMTKAGVYNRALVLISFSRMINTSDDNNINDNLGLHKYSSGSNSYDDEIDPADEEDALLTSNGIAFSRKVLLS